jgi:hypothetical protein
MARTASWWWLTSLVGLLGLASTAMAQSSDLTALASMYPACALECMVEYIPQSSCITADGLNQTCVCNNEELNRDVEVCAMQSCSVKELLSTFYLCVPCPIR